MLRSCIILPLWNIITIIVLTIYNNCFHRVVVSWSRSALPAIHQRRALHRLPRHHHCSLDVRGRVQRHLLRAAVHHLHRPDQFHQWVLCTYTVWYHSKWDPCYRSHALTGREVHVQLRFQGSTARGFLFDFLITVWSSVNCVWIL